MACRLFGAKPLSKSMLDHMCTFLLQSGALWDIWVMHCGICETGLLHFCIRYHVIVDHIITHVTVLILSSRDCNILYYVHEFSCFNLQLNVHCYNYWTNFLWHRVISIPPVMQFAEPNCVWLRFTHCLSNSDQFRDNINLAFSLVFIGVWSGLAE